jgi:hypothetical protein
VFLSFLIIILYFPFSCIPQFVSGLYFFLSFQSEWWERKTKEGRYWNGFFYRKEVERERIIADCYTYRERMAHTNRNMYVNRLIKSQNGPAQLLLNFLVFFGARSGRRHILGQTNHKVHNGTPPEYFFFFFFFKLPFPTVKKAKEL